MICTLEHHLTQGVSEPGVGLGKSAAFAVMAGLGVEPRLSTHTTSQLLLLPFIKGAALCRPGLAESLVAEG